MKTLNRLVNSQHAMPVLAAVVSAIVVATMMNAKSELDLHKQRLASAQYCVKVISSMQSNAK